ncbi:unnamed protein product [Schistosoma intercalatum]|nr:unnamed protein product [Schistosoma intercalatum]
MSATCDFMASVSGLTLSYFKDTGWYNVDISMAKPWDWGRGQGCDFIFKSCGEFIKSQRTSSPWCDELNDANFVHCIPHMNAYGICNLKDLSLPLNPEHIHFDSLPNIVPSELSRFGGSDTYADHCPYLSVKCSLEFKHLVYFRGDWRECPIDGGIMKIYEDSTSHDWIQCPRFHDVCSVS